MSSHKNKQINIFTTGTHCTLLMVIESKGTFLVDAVLHIGK